VTPEIRRRATALGVLVRPSTKATKKLDAFDSRTGEFIASFGGRGCKDFHVWKAESGPLIAEAKRRAYKRRHEADRHVMYRDGKLTAGYLADKILW
jgi:hypothetical protein